MGFIAPIISSATPFFHRKDSQFKYFPLVVHQSTHPHISDIHWHDYAQLWYCSAGSYVHTINGERVLQTPGTLAIVPPFAIHSVDTTKTDFEKSEICYLSLDFESINEQQIPFFSIKYNLSTFENFMLPPFLRFKGKDKDICDELFSKLLRKNDSQLEFSSAITLAGEILELCAKNINEYLPASDLASGKEQLSLIKNSLNYITDSSASKISLEKASKYAMMSQRSFTEKFKTCIGQTAHNYLTNVRIMHAFKLLRYSDLSISDISDICGFSNSGHFIRLCLKNLEASPSQVRENVHNWDNTYRNDMHYRGKIRASLNSW